MANQFATGFTVDALIIVESLGADERKTGKYLYDDLSAFCLKQNIHSSHISVERADHFRELMRQLTRLARERALRPILHLDIHGLDDRSGLLFLPSRERLLWSEFALLARELNEATCNNLFVVMAVCHGFHAVLEVKIGSLTPFCILIGSQGVVMNQQILSEFSPFYREMFEHNEVENPFRRLLSVYRQYTCEELLVTSFSRYFREACMGAGRRRRVESLITKARALAHQIPLRDMRQFAKAFTRPAPEAFERFRRTFLMADHPNNAGRFTVTYDDVMKAVGQQ